MLKLLFDIMGCEGLILLGILIVIGVIGAVCIWSLIIDFIRGIIDFIRGER